MTEQGVVVAVEKSGATVEIQKKDECSKCGLCAFPKNASKIRVYAENSVGAKKGDTVTIERSGKTSLFSVFMVFLVPLLLIGLAVGINYLTIKNEIWIPILSVLFIFLWYTILALIDKKFQKLKGLTSVIVSVETVEKEEKGEE